LEAARAQFEARTKELETELANSLPKTEVEALKERVAKAEQRLAESTAELAAAKARVKELEPASSEPSGEERLAEAPNE
jgi:uncharacterized coiled-coil protein SlyX